MEAFTRGRGRKKEVFAEIQELRAEMGEEIEDMKAKYVYDWRTNQETTWTDGTEVLAWDPPLHQTFIDERSGALQASQPDMTNTERFAMQYFLNEPTKVEYEPMDIWIRGPRDDQ